VPGAGALREVLEASPGAVVATDLASVDADYDNGTALRDSARS